MKKLLNLFLLFILIFSLTGCSKNENTENLENNNQNNINNSSTNTARLSTNSSEKSNNSITNTIEIKQAGHDNPIAEIEMASFTTKLVGSPSARTNNISITCGILDGTIVENGKTFSFCNTIGKPTADRGYQEADAFDREGNTFKAYGGGNCQVSSTLYNVVLQIPEFEVIERHPHSKKVQYVPEGKDAAVATGSVDFKFKNNSGCSIKIYAYSDLNSVNIRIVKLG